MALAALLCFTFACQNKAEKAELEKFRAQAKVEEENKALVIRYRDALQKGDIEALKEVFSPDYVGHDSRGRSATLEKRINNINQTRKMFSDIAYISEDLIAKGDKVIVRYIAKGTHIGDFLGMPGTGNEIKTTGIEIDRVENAKIVESWEASDDLGIFEQLGMELKPKVTKK